MKHQNRILAALIVPVLIFSACRSDTTSPTVPTAEPSPTTAPAPTSLPPTDVLPTDVPPTDASPTGISPTLTPTPSVSGPVADLQLPSESNGPLPFQAYAVLGLGQIGTYALSPDGEYLAIGGEAALRLYQLDPFEELWCAETSVWHIQWIETDGVPQIITHVDDRLQTWNIESGVQISEVVLTHSGVALSHIVWSPNKTLIAAASRDRLDGDPSENDTIIIWEASSGEVLQEIRNLGQIKSLEWSSNGDALISVSAYSGDSTTTSGGQVFLWSIETGNALTAIDVLARSTALSPNGKVLAIGRADGSISLLEANTFIPIRSLRAKLNEFSGVLTWSPDGRQIAGGGVGEFAIWDVERDELPRIIYFEVDATPQVVTGLEWSPDGKQLGVGTTRSGIMLDVDSGQPVNTTDEGHEVYISFTPDGDYYLSQGADAIEIWSTEDHELIHSLVGTPGIAAVAFNAEGTILYAAGEDRIIAWDVADREPLRVLGGPMEHRIERLGISANGQYLLTEVSGNVVLLWDLHTGEYGWLPYETLLGTGAPSNLFTMMDQNGLAIWDITTYEEVHRFEEPATAVAWSPDRALLAIATDGIALYDPKTWEPTGIVGSESLPYPVRQLAFSPGGQRIAALLDDGTMVGWAVSNNERLFSLSEGVISSVEWSLDGKLLYAGSSRRAGGRVLRWNTPNAELMPSFKGHARPVSTIALSPDGTILASGSSDGTVILWSIDP